MAGETVITVVGNLTDDPELRFTPSGVAVANFRLASTPRSYDKQANEWRDGDPLFVACNAWREVAENVAESLQKGMRVVVTGSLKTRQYERRDGSKGLSVEVEVEEVGPSLRWATAKVTRSRGGNGNRQQAQQQTRQNADPWAGAPASSDPWGPSTGSDEPPF